MSDHVENTPAEGVNPQVTEQVIPESQEGAGEAANLNADSQLRGEPGSENTGIETDAKPQGRATARIQQLIEQKKKSDAEAAFWRQRAQSLQTNSDNPADYADEAARHEAIVRQGIRNARREDAEAAAQLAAETAFRARVETFNERAADFRQKAPDFDAVAFRHPSQGGPQITELMAEVIQEADAGPQIAYWLGKNQGEAARIASLPPVKQVAEIGKLEARLSTPVKRTTQAPRPPKTISGATASSTPSLSDIEAMDNETYRKMRMGK